MSTTLWAVVFDSAAPEPLAAWWAEALGWAVVTSTEYDAEVRCRSDADLPRLGFERVDDTKVVKNRVHLDLSSSSTQDQAATVDRLRGMGAAAVSDSPTRDFSWVVLADPEGNEFCVLEPRDRSAGDVSGGALAAIVVDVVDPMALEKFYAAATGWPVAERTTDVVTLRRPEGRPPDLDLVRVSEVKSTKNRVHLDLAPSDGTDVEVARLRALGADEIDVGQGSTASWRVLADPEGNEVCILSPR